MNKKIGLDRFSSDLCSLDILYFFQKSELYCYHVVEKNNRTIFYTRISDRKRIIESIPNATYEYTTGIFGMLLRNIINKYRLISYLIVIVLWISFSNCIFSFEVLGENDVIEKEIYNFLESYWLTYSNQKEIKNTLYRKFKEDVSWLEVYDEGNVIKVKYTLNGSVTNTEKKNQSLIAKKDGMIVLFDCTDGYKLKKVNDIVKKGEVLVDYKMKDSYMNDVDLDVNGRVMAYTWNKVEVETKNNKLPKAINYFSLLLEARSKLDININEGEKIVKENVLHFTTNEGKIKLILLYTLLEDITS